MTVARSSAYPFMSFPDQAWLDRPWPRRSCATTRNPFWARKSICSSQASELSGHPGENVTTGALAPVFVVDCRAIVYRKRAHMNFLIKFVSLGKQNYSQFHVLVGGHQYRSAFLLHEEHDEFRRFSLTCVPPNDVDIIRAFVEGLTRCQSRLLSASHLHHD